MEFILFRTITLTILTLGGRKSEWSRPRPSRFFPGKGTLYPFYNWLGGTRDLCVWIQKYRKHRSLKPGRSSPQRVAVPSESYKNIRPKY